MALIAKTLRREGIFVSANQEVFVKTIIDKDEIENSIEGMIKVPQWKRVEVEEKGKKKNVRM